MSDLLHDFIQAQVKQRPSAPALYYKDQVFDYSQLNDGVQDVANGLSGLGLSPGERVAFYLPKQPEAIMSLFGVSLAGGVFVPVNPLLKPKQVAYILKDCNVRTLITSSQRLKGIAEELEQCHDLHNVVIIEGTLPEQTSKYAKVLSWPEFTDSSYHLFHRRIDADIAAILYTSGSTGNPKGVILSHKNIVTGAKSVAEYLNNSVDDRLLGVLPLSFDYGLSQLTSAFYAGASVALLDYLLPRDIIRALARYHITGLAGVPPIWNQLVQQDWSSEAVDTLRYITNSGGTMPRSTTEKLQTLLPDTDIFLMYGLTEAFRSTYLPPDQLNLRPESIGKAIPNAEIRVLRDDGSECAPGEPGELVHRGSLVALGYWNNPEKTAERFKPLPNQDNNLPIEEIAVWSGDQVKKDDDGYLYFISRKDEMIKTSGYRVSPTEVEEVAYQLGAINEAAALGINHPSLGQAILLSVTVTESLTAKEIQRHCAKFLPSFMLPAAIEILEDMPHNQNGKIDRRQLNAQYHTYFQE